MGRNETEEQCRERQKSFHNHLIHRKAEKGSRSKLVIREIRASPLLLSVPRQPVIDSTSGSKWDFWGVIQFARENSQNKFDNLRPRSTWLVSDRQGSQAVLTFFVRRFSGPGRLLVLRCRSNSPRRLTASVPEPEEASICTSPASAQRIQTSHPDGQLLRDFR